jgi:imidazolonepropionase-like amidohydrolase
VLDRASVLVLGGVIAAVAPGLRAPRRIRTYDGQGRTLLPGLIDAHVHTSETGLGDALRFGVTTELDMFGDPAMLAEAKPGRRSLRRTARADLWSAGIGVTVPGGHPLVPGWDFPRLTPDAAPAAFVAARVSEGSDYIKLVIETGGNPPFETLTPEQVNAVVAAAHRHRKLAVAHAERVAHVRTAIEAGVDGLVHVAIDAPLDDAMVRAIRDLGAFVVPTVPVLDCGISADDLLADPRVQPYLSDEQTYLLHQRKPVCRPSFRELSLVNLARLHAAGVPTIAGTDAPLPGTANGASMYGELDALVEAGLPPRAALAAATGVTARAFGLADRGRILPGRRADLLLVAGDPLADIKAIRDLELVLKNGYAVDRTPPRS